MVIFSMKPCPEGTLSAIPCGQQRSLSCGAVQYQLVSMPRPYVRVVNLALLDPLLHYRTQVPFRSEQQPGRALALNVLKEAPDVKRVVKSYLLI